MNDPFGVRGIQCVGNLDSQVQQCFQFYRPRSYAMLQSYSIQKLHGNERLAVLLADVVNRADVRMIQRRSGLRFALKAGEGLRLPGNIVGQELERDEAVQARVFRFVNHAHTAAANFFDNAIVGNGLADHEEWQLYSRSILWTRQAVVNGGFVSCSGSLGFRTLALAALKECERRIDAATATNPELSVALIVNASGQTFGAEGDLDPRRFR